MSSGGQPTGLPPMTASLLETGMWSDLTITSKGQVWKVHRLMVGLQSKPFRAAINGEFEEAKSGVIKLDEHDPEIVGHMIKFMYSGDYTASVPRLDLTLEDEPTESAASEAPSEEVARSDTTGAEAQADTSQELLVHTAVYLIAEEKDIPALKELAKKKYAEALPKGWNSEAFCTSLRLIYEETPESDRLLWDVAINFAGQKAKELIDREEFVELWKEKGEIGLEVFRAHLSPPTVQCSTTFQFGRSAILTATKKVPCPEKGLAHAKYVVKGRRMKHFCHVCKKAFN